METNAENIPEIIFEWLGQFNFDELSFEQEQEVLTHFTEEEYRQLRLAYRGIQQNRQEFVAPGREARKQVLMDKFDEKYAPSNKVIPMTKPLAFWKAAAAVVVLFGSGWLCSSIVESQKTTQDQLAIADTVYVTRQSPGIHDTVYVELPAKHESKSPIIHTTAIRPEKKKPLNTAGNEQDFQVVSVSQMNSLANVQKRNSMRDDSLWRRLTIVSL